MSDEPPFQMSRGLFRGLRDGILGRLGLWTYAGVQVIPHGKSRDRLLRAAILLVPSAAAAAAIVILPESQREAVARTINEMVDDGSAPMAAAAIGVGVFGTIGAIGHPLASARARRRQVKVSDVEIDPYNQEIPFVAFRVDTAGQQITDLHVTIRLDKEWFVVDFNGPVFLPPDGSISLRHKLSDAQMAEWARGAEPRATSWTYSVDGVQFSRSVPSAPELSY